MAYLAGWCAECIELVKTGKMNDNMSLELLIIKYSSERKNQDKERK